MNWIHHIVAFIKQRGSKYWHKYSKLSLWLKVLCRNTSRSCRPIAPTTVQFSEHWLVIKQEVQSINVFYLVTLVLICDVRCLFHSAESAWAINPLHLFYYTKKIYYYTKKEKNLKHLLTFHTQFIELFMHVTSAFNGLKVDMAAIKHTMCWEKSGQAGLATLTVVHNCLWMLRCYTHHLQNQVNSMSFRRNIDLMHN